MPRYEEIISCYNRGTVVEKKVTEVTSWVQMSGPWMIRCDDEAKSGDRGLWVLFDTSRNASSSWKGTWGPGYGFKPDPNLWIRNELTNSYTREKDYS
jgi:hypothetical protein